MIRINLIGVERQTKKSFSFDISQQVPLACALVALLTVGGTGWWYWSLQQRSQRMDAQFKAAEREGARLKTLLAEVKAFEDRTAQLQDRVKLIETLRTGQSVPVQLLDHISRSLPDSLWLTQVQQDGATLTIEGRSTTLIALSDFVGNLGNTTIVQKPVEIVSSQVVSSDDKTNKGALKAPDLISFVVRAQIVGGPQVAETTGKKKGRA